MAKKDLARATMAVAVVGPRVFGGARLDGTVFASTAAKPAFASAILTLAILPEELASATVGVVLVLRVLVVHTAAVVGLRIPHHAITRALQGANLLVRQAEGRGLIEASERAGTILVAVLGFPSRLSRTQTKGQIEVGGNMSICMFSRLFHSRRMNIIHIAILRCFVKNAVFRCLTFWKYDINLDMFHIVSNTISG